MTSPTEEPPRKTIDLGNVIVRKVALPGARSEPGAKVTTVYVERRMKAYAIHEYEIDSIGTNNALAAIFFSLGSAAFALSTGIWTNACFSEKLTAAGELMTKFVAPICVVACVVLLLLGKWALKKRSKIWARIRDESNE